MPTTTGIYAGLHPLIAPGRFRLEIPWASHEAASVDRRLTAGVAAQEVTRLLSGASTTKWRPNQARQNKLTTWPNRGHDTNKELGYKNRALPDKRDFLSRLGPPACRGGLSLLPR